MAVRSKHGVLRKRLGRGDTGSRRSCEAVSVVSVVSAVSAVTAVTDVTDVTVVTVVSVVTVGRGERRDAPTRKRQRQLLGARTGQQGTRGPCFPCLVSCSGSIAKITWLERYICSEQGCRRDTCRVGHAFRLWSVELATLHGSWGWKYQKKKRARKKAVLKEEQRKTRQERGLFFDTHHNHHPQYCDSPPS